MIKTENGNTTIQGGLPEMLAEASIVLANVYVALKIELGEEIAKQMIVEVGRKAMDEDVIAEIEKRSWHGVQAGGTHE